MVVNMPGLVPCCEKRTFARWRGKQVVVVVGKKRQE
jgi:hypothetical protein